MSDSSERQIAVFGSIGFVSMMFFGSVALFVCGWLSHAAFIGRHWPEPTPWPQPQPQPQPYFPIPDNDQWFTPQQSVLNQLPRNIADGMNRNRQAWRWEVNQRYEYRYHRVPGDAGESPIGEMPKTMSPPEE